MDAPPEKFSKFDIDLASGDCRPQPQITNADSNQRRVKLEPTERNVEIFANCGESGTSIKKNPLEEESPLIYHQY